MLVNFILCFLHLQKQHRPGTSTTATGQVCQIYICGGLFGKSTGSLGSAKSRHQSNNTQLEVDLETISQYNNYVHYSDTDTNIAGTILFTGREQLVHARPIRALILGTCKNSKIN